MLLSFLGYVDKIGVAFEAPTISTGFGAYLAQVRVNQKKMFEALSLILG